MSKKFKDSLKSYQRTLPLNLYIDPGFVHHRKIETILGEKGISLINDLIEKIPSNTPDWQKPTQIDHIYTRIFLQWLSIGKIKTLSEVLAAQNGTLVLSVEKVSECFGDIYHDLRVFNNIHPNGNADIIVKLEYSTRHISGDTLKSSLSNGHDTIAIAAEVTSFNQETNTLILHPLILGFPWLEGEADFSPEWFGTKYFEVFIDDIDEFSKVREIEIPQDFKIMEDISESAFKECVAEILGEQTRPDWGGEQSDHFSRNLHLNGRRTTGAFLFKGPAKFSPMGLNHLGKNNDQIYRLAQEPAQLLLVQHCHEILPPVAATLRAFAVQPASARNYCLIDGRDSLRLLIAYKKLERALELSKK